MKQGLPVSLVTIFNISYDWCTDRKMVIVVQSINLHLRKVAHLFIIEYTNIIEVTNNVKVQSQHYINVDVLSSIYIAECCMKWILIEKFMNLMLSQC